MKNIFILSALWCFGSMFGLLAWHYRMAWRLSRAGVPLSLFFLTTPGYLSGKYIDWCEQTGGDPSPQLRRLRWWKISLLVAFAVTFLIVIPNMEVPPRRR